jgi:hypothetical protein
MNERIKSLLDRAEYQAEKHPGPDWEVYVEPSREQILEKFAELIVRECSRVAKLEVGTNRVCDAIEKHFGVE